MPIGSTVAAVFLTGAFWLGVLVFFDDHRKEKGSTREVLISFGVGFASVPLALLLYRFTPYVLSGLDSAPSREMALEFLVVGPVEEFSKFLIFLLITSWRKPVQEPMDAVLCAATIALSFSLVENVIYGFNAGPEIAALRGAVATPMHLSFATVWGFAYAVLVYHNRHRQPRDYVVLLFSVYPAAVLHGLSNVLLDTIGYWAFLSDLFFFACATATLLWLRGKSPFGPLRLANSYAAAVRIEAALAGNNTNYSLNFRAAVVRVAAKDYVRARGHIEQCMRLRPGKALGLALSAVISFLEGNPERGEQQLGFSYPSLSAQERRLIARIVRHIVKSPETNNAYNEFLLSMWLKTTALSKAGFQTPSWKR